MIYVPEEKPTSLVLSALPYANGVKHIGNLVGSLLPADVFARFLRMQGADVIYICGTDEHGTTIEVAALKAGMTPQAFADKYHAKQKEIYQKWNLSFDYFGRTSGAENHATTQEIFKAIYDNGFVVEKEMQTPYCLNDKRFLPDRYIEGTCPHCGYDGARGDQCEKCGRVLDPADLRKPHCNVCGKSEIEFRKTKHLFLQLQKMSEQLKSWISSQEHWPQNARNFALQWIAQGLHERCITRDLSWGVKVPLPDYEEKVFYVWFDAPIGYVSFTKEWAKQKGDPTLWEHYWRNKDCKIVNVLGKDNLAFHTVIWPAMLMASNYANLPSQVKSLEFLNLEGKKFSTSRNWGINSDEALEWFPADYWRYYLCSILPEQGDADFSLHELMQKSNKDLADAVGNLVHRCLSFTHMNFGGKVPTPGEMQSSDNDFWRSVKKQVASSEESFYAYRWQEALREAMQIAHESNKYFNDGEPWKKVKEGDEGKAKAATTVFMTLQAVRSLAVVLAPFIPASSQKVFDYLKLGPIELATWDSAAEQKLPGGHEIAPMAEIRPIFTKIDPAAVAKLKAVLDERAKPEVAGKLPAKA